MTNSSRGGLLSERRFPRQMRRTEVCTYSDTCSSQLTYIRRGSAPYERAIDVACFQKLIDFKHTRRHMYIQKYVYIPHYLLATPRRGYASSSEVSGSVRELSKSSVNVVSSSNKLLGIGGSTNSSSSLLGTYCGTPVIFTVDGPAFGAVEGFEGSF